LNKVSVNYFGDGMDGERYARSRPYIHPTAVARFRAFAQIEAPLSRALDVACGTGQSTVLLTEIAERVIGIDPSADMLHHAMQHPRVAYLQSVAEQTPFSDGKFDLITVAQAFHWFHHETFLDEACRLLRVPGWVLIYTSWFTGKIKDEPAFSDWFKGEYLKRYPIPPRNRNPVTEELARRHGLIFRGEEKFSNEVAMTIHRFRDFQLSTTNIIAAVEEARESYEDAARWIQSSLEPFFAETAERTFLFSGKIWHMEKTVV
jgi:ubiquinone/menaquinone biosynthesis C-methylase UbiE